MISVPIPRGADKSGPIVPSPLLPKAGRLREDLGHEEVRGRCQSGIGALLRDRSNSTSGKDAQLPCKRNTCDVCGPENRRRKESRVVGDFAGLKMHRVDVADGSKEWQALRKTLERADALYHRIPAPEGMAAILTDAEIGDLVEKRPYVVRQVIEAQPCDGRHMSSSRQWKGAGDRSTGRWKREGTSHLPRAQRFRIYTEERCRPIDVPDKALPPGVENEFVLELPPNGTGAWERLRDRLELNTHEAPPLGPGGWPIPRRLLPTGCSERLQGTTKNCSIV